MFNAKSEMLLNPDKLPPVHIVGCGSTGSFVAFYLAKMGVKDLHLYDFDNVSHNNVGNQLFGYTDIGDPKVKALSDIIYWNTDTVVETYNEKVKGKKFDGIVFILTDTMKSRENIIKANIRNEKCPLLIETRLGVYDSRVYAIDPNNPKHTKNLIKTLGTDKSEDIDSELVSDCGVRQDLISSANIVAGLAVQKLLHWHNNTNKDLPLVNELLIGFMNSIFITENIWD